MSKSADNGEKRRCPVCGRGVLRERIISELFEYGDVEDVVTVKTQDVPIEDCDVCGESFSGPEAAAIRQAAIGAALGLLSGKEIRAIRERLGQSIERFANLLGVRKDRLSKWENGTIWQDRMADRLLRLLAISDENVKHLESLVTGTQERAEDFGSEALSTGSKKSRRRVIPRHERERFGL